MRPRHDKDLAPFALHPLSTILALPFDTAAAPQSAMPGAMRAIPKLHTAAQVGFNPLHIFQLRQLQLSQRMPFLTYSTHNHLILQWYISLQVKPLVCKCILRRVQKHHSTLTFCSQDTPHQIVMNLQIAAGTCCHNLCFRHKCSPYPTPRPSAST